MKIANGRPGAVTPSEAQAMSQRQDLICPQKTKSPGIKRSYPGLGLSIVCSCAIYL